jgi:lysylphosphatidylglycerol synthetase-like protein (DUF2156 family)
MNNSPKNLDLMDSEYVKSLLEKEKKKRAPMPVRLVADICLLLLLVGFAEKIILALMLHLPLPMAWLMMAVVTIVLLLGYRKAKKWALLSIAVIYIINVSTWVFDIYRGTPPEFGRWALGSVGPTMILVVGAMNWKKFS